jgi:hypothetical protein
MKIRRLSEIDLARFCATPAAWLERDLISYETGGGSWSYNPARSSAPDALAARTELLGEIPCPTWPQLKDQIARLCKYGQVQVDANQQVTKALFDSRVELEWQSAKVLMGQMSIGFGENVRYWHDVVVDDGAGPFVPFFDHRREHGVTNAEIRRIVFSMQDAWVRARNPDLAAARLAVVRFPKCGNERTLSIDFDEGVELLTYDELNQRVQNVYAVWARVCRDRADKRRGSGGSGPGSLGL